MTDIYIPDGSHTLDSIVDRLPQIRLGLQSRPGEGKTWAALTFKNPLVLNMNRGLGAHVGRKDVIDVPIYEPIFCDKLATRLNTNAPPNKRDAIMTWLRKEANKITTNQTLIVDSISDIERAFDMQESLEPVITSKGEVNTMAFWQHKIEYFGELLDILMSVKCDIVVCVHEQLDRDTKGNLNGKLKPLLSGQSGDKLAKDFTDWFRQIASSKPAPDKITPQVLKSFGMSQPEFKTWLDSFPRETVYYWQTDSDDIFSGKCSSLVNFSKYIPADYSSFIKYRRKISPVVS